MRHGMYWSGDLPTAMPTAGSTLPDELRTGCVSTGEPTTAPIERILLRLPVIQRVAVYPVPDEYVAIR